LKEGIRGGGLKAQESSASLSLWGATIILENFKGEKMASIKHREGQILLEQGTITTRVEVGNERAGLASEKSGRVGK